MSPSASKLRHFEQGTRRVARGGGRGVAGREGGRDTTAGGDTPPQIPSEPRSSLPSAEPSSQGEGPLGHQTLQGVQRDGAALLAVPGVIPAVFRMRRRRGDHHQAASRATELPRRRNPVGRQQRLAGRTRQRGGSHGDGPRDETLVAAVAPIDGVLFHGSLLVCEVLSAVQRSRKEEAELELRRPLAGVNHCTPQNTIR